MRNEKTKRSGNKRLPRRNGQGQTLPKMSEKRQKLTIELLDLLNRQTSETDTIREILLLMKRFTGFEAVAIRLQDGDDFPYYVSNGFPGSFIEAETSLCKRDKNGNVTRDSNGCPHLECMCGNVIRGRFDASLPFFTGRGSFWTNSTTRLLATTSTDERQSETRDRCNGEGYESVALIPLRSDSNVIGLLQLNDSRKNRFTRERINFFEDIGAAIGIALARVQVEEKIRKSKKILSGAERIAGLGSWEWDLPQNRLTLSDGIYDIFGIKQVQEPGKAYETITNLIDPKDRKRVSRKLEMARKKKGSIDLEYSIIRPDGERRIMRTKAEAIGDKRGRPVRILGLTQDITEQTKAREALYRAQAELEKRVKERTAELAETNKQLKQKKDDLEKKNIALHEILAHINDEKEAMKRQITSNIEEAIIPAIARLKRLSDPAILRSFEILERNLMEVSSPFLDTLRNKYRSLTPREVEVCRLIKYGCTSKEIARTLHISEQTVIKQRKTIRKKLGINNQAINLASFLESITA